MRAASKLFVSESRWFGWRQDLRLGSSHEQDRLPSIHVMHDTDRQLYRGGVYYFFRCVCLASSCSPSGLFTFDVYALCCAVGGGKSDGVGLLPGGGRGEKSGGVVSRWAGIVASFARKVGKWYENRGLETSNNHGIGW